MLRILLVILFQVLVVILGISQKSHSQDISDFILLENEEYQQSLHSLNKKELSSEELSEFYSTLIDSFKNTEPLGYCYFSYRFHEKLKSFTIKFDNPVNFDDYFTNCENLQNDFIRLQVLQTSAYQSMIKRDSIDFFQHVNTILGLSDSLSYTVNSSTKNLQCDVVAHTLWNSLLFDNESYSEKIDSVLLERKCSTELTSKIRLYYLVQYNKIYEAIELLKSELNVAQGDDKIRICQNICVIYLQIEDWKSIESIIKSTLTPNIKTNDDFRIILQLELLGALISQNKLSEAGELLSLIQSKIKLEEPFLHIKTQRFLYQSGQYYEAVDSLRKAEIKYTECYSDRDVRFENIHISKCLESLMVLNPEKYSTLQNHLYLADSIHTVNKNNESLFSINFLSQFYSNQQDYKTSLIYSNRAKKIVAQNKRKLRDFYESKRNDEEFKSRENSDLKDHVKGLNSYLKIFGLLVAIGLVVFLYLQFIQLKKIKDYRTVNSFYIKKLESYKDIITENTQYFSGIAHDIRSPLLKLKHINEQLEDSKIKKKNKLLTEAKEINTTVENMIQELDNFLYKKQNIKNKEKEIIDIKSLAETSLRLIDPELKRDSLFTFEGLRQITSYTSTLQTVFKNCIENTLKYNRQAKIKILISCQKNDDGAYHFKIMDNGIIKTPPNHKSKITSFGLGLKLCKISVEKLGGTFSAEQKTEGFLVEFTMP